MPREIPSEILIRAERLGTVEVEQLGNFLRDLVFLHDRLWIISSNEHADYPLDAGFFYTRSGRPIPPEQSLRLIRINEQSPLELQIAIQSAIVGIPGAAWVFFQLVRGALLLPGELRIQKLQEEKLRNEVPKLGSQVPILDLPDRTAEIGRIYEEDLGKRNVPSSRRETELRLLLRDVQRIGEDGFRITQVEVTKTVVQPT